MDEPGRRAPSLSGETRLFAILGDPIAQVKSPGGMTQGFAARGRDAILVPMHVASSDLAGVVERLARIRNFDGTIATMPHKFACFDLCASVGERARVLRAVNVMRRDHAGGWHGDMLDGLAFVAAIEAKGFAPRDRNALLVGAGGAGSAIGLALLEAGVARLAIHDSDPTRRAALIALLTRRAPGRVTVGTNDPASFDLVAHATPAGMHEDDPLPIDVARLSPGCFVGCLITAPAISPLVAAARAKGCATSSGGDLYEASQRLMLDFFIGV